MTKSFLLFLDGDFDRLAAEGKSRNEDENEDMRENAGTHLRLIEEGVKLV